MKMLQFKLNMPVGGFSEGTIINLVCDENGCPNDLAWRKYLKGSEFDNCMERISGEMKSDFVDISRLKTHKDYKKDRK